MSAPAIVLVVVVAVLFAVGFDLLMQRSLVQIVVGFTLLGHGANLVLLLAGGAAGTPPLLGAKGPRPMVDPFPQAMVLTAIVITFGVTAFLLAMAYRSRLLRGGDGVQDDVEDRRIHAERRRRGEAPDATPLETENTGPEDGGPEGGRPGSGRPESGGPENVGPGSGGPEGGA